MKPSRSSGLELIRARLESYCGFSYDEHTLARLERALQGRMELRGAPDLDAYLRLLSGLELKELADELTIGETYFFRHREQLSAFLQHVVPGLARKRENGQTIRILSAGCATGEEPYSLAILIRESLGTLEGIEILGIDLNPALLARARRGHFSSWSLRQTATRDRLAWFDKSGNDWVLKDEIRRRVRFEERNLVEESAGFWRPERFDAIFCRNVMIYLSDEKRVRVVNRFRRSLKPDGTLFLGHAETLRGLSEDFEVTQAKDAFFYRIADEAGATRPAASVSGAGSGRAARPADSKAAVEGPGIPMPNWQELITRYTRRIHELTAREEREPALEHVPVPVPVDRTEDHSEEDWVEAVLDDIRGERFAEALRILERVSVDPKWVPEALIFRSAVLLARGDLAQAESSARSLLLADDLNAGAYYVLGVCSERTGDLPAASGFLQRAIYLDDRFSLPHLQLAFLRRQQGERVGACSEFRTAESLLQGEDTVRLTLFSGGFSREALVAICRRGRRDCEAAA